MNIYTFFVIFLIVSMFFIQTIADLFNIKNISNNIPREFKNCYENKKYEKSQKYLKTNTKFSIISSMFFVTIQIVFIIFGGFNYLNTIVVSFKFCEILTGLCFVGILFFIYEILKIPFSAYFVFVIEEKFGFNKMNVKIFISDLLKSWIITLIIGSVLFSTILLIFTNFHKYAWLYSFVGVVIFKFFVIFIAPIIIMPIFNKYTPLEDGELKSSIEKYIKTENFKMNGLF
ncbi:MAG: hypothetical protein LBH27_00920, partial [Endomicrobium sp.]|nr:hypothetical protein [Endomicrobium sp.]